MKISLPSHLLLTPQSQRLLQIMGNDRPKTIVCIFELWIALAMAIEEHGGSGYLSDSQGYLLNAQLESTTQDATGKLTASGFLVRQDGGWHSPIFAYYNSSLDANYIADPEAKDFDAFRVRMEKLGFEAMNALKEVDPQCWYRADGRKAEANEMRSAVVLIKSIDLSLDLGRRKDHEFDAGLVSAALVVVDAFDWKKIEMVLLRLEQKRRSKFIVRRTSWALENWNSLVCALAHPGGWDDWFKNMCNHVKEGR